MDAGTLKFPVIFLSAAALVAAGCGDDPNKVLPHSADEQKAIGAYNSMTPQQQIDAIQNGHMPEAAKPAMIQRIKDKYGLK